MLNNLLKPVTTTVVCLFCVCACSGGGGGRQDNANNGGSEEASLHEKLGFSNTDKLIIIHADDIGLNHSENEATIAAFESGAINSGSVMVPAPAFDEIAIYAVEHPEYDIGLHLTLTSEWVNVRWSGVAPSAEIPSLLDSDGFLYASVEAFVQHAKLDEVEKELRAQIDYAIQSGMAPTHIDSHMGVLFSNQGLFETYLKLGREYGIPAVFPKNFSGYFGGIPAAEQNLDKMYYFDGSETADIWTQKYNGFIGGMREGELSELIIHLGFDNQDMQYTTEGFDDFGAAWRQRDFDYVMGDEFKNLLSQEGVKQVTWREIQAQIYP